ncbi:MAG: FdtA/QdtA family cupin domain-containing protein [Magnetococcales bacterium]|nr:FdtA/QdtA family cupin domain-containing protein [Magnetococcales bacterium]
MSQQLFSIDGIRQLSFPKFSEDTGDLCIYESGQDIPMDIKRVFSVNSTHKGSKRGEHAHYNCVQILICLNGSCRVDCDDGKQKKTFILNSPDKGLYIPASIWVEQTYTEDGSTLLVLCDHVFSEDDYIRDYDDFISYRNFGKVK